MSKILRNGKWRGIWDREKYQTIRNKILDTFKDLVFVEGPHKYYIDGKEITCVSNVTHMYQEHFDEKLVAQKTFERNFDNPDSKYYQMTPVQIIESWHKISSDACSHGTERHEFGESCLYFMTGQYDKILPAFKERLKEDENGEFTFEAVYPKEEAIVKFWEDIPQCIVPILAETKVYDKELMYSGTFDILFYYDAELDGKDARKSGLWVYDYKSNKDLYKNYNEKKLLAPFNELLDMPLSIYKLQLSLYQNCLEKIGLNVIARTIIWMKPNGTYDKIKLESYVDVLKEDLSYKVSNNLL